MFINPNIITPAQSVEARENLSLQQPVVVSGIKAQYPGIVFPKTYLSEFESGSRNLPPKTLSCLRGFYEEQGHKFADVPNAVPSSSVASPSPRLDASLKVEYFFPLSNNIPDEVIGNAMDIMEENDARLAVLLKAKAEREQGFFGDGELTEETEAVLQETFALLAGNYVIFRMLRGWRAFNQPPADENSKTVRDVLLETFKQPLIDAGLIEPDAKPAEEVEEAEEVQS